MTYQNVGVTAIRSSWQPQADHLLCRWTEMENGATYSASWVKESEQYAAERDPRSLPLDLDKLSRFGGKEWWSR